LSNNIPVTTIGKILEEFYQNSGIRRNNGQDCPSYVKCSSSCKLEGREITPPTGLYFGEAYEEKRILFIGINTNCGSASSKDFYSCYRWISKKGTEESISIDGAIHRIVKKILNNSNMPKEETRRHFAFTNLVKCSVDKSAGSPTKTMWDNCEVKHGYLFEEVNMLKPRMIIALGRPPFYAIKSHYIDTVEHFSPNFKEWMFSFKMGSNLVVVWFAYNPGQGYQTPRNYWKKIKEKNSVEGWKIFLPPEVTTTKQLEEYLLKTYNGQTLVDKKNPFYEMLLDRLIAVANKK